MNRLIYIIILLTCLAKPASAQYTFSGKIEYERKINIWGIVADYNDKSWLENTKSSTKQFHTSYFDMAFNRSKCLYKPGREVEGNDKSPWTIGPAKENSVLTDLVAKRVKASKLVYEQKFLVQDTMRRLQWKERGEIRTIANYKCHKAVAVICDSVYVVAFYTEDIPAGGGPEMFGGLPGMILELAIPRLHTTWTATKVETANPAEADFTLPDKGKKVDQKGLYDAILAGIADWGKWGTKNIWWTVL